ncbi:RidA family protein [Tengunoibacter tsumagoiensis]|uniref:Enamine deaminase RidA n=1 Tax=Tengunoibacter tsumagoiensis TaxID=2014871 RepID=A0A401ZVT0_9CHLR|nr:RidA family protein [Tengunoibacter tsumagoiensis]GCE10892.1 hypothetical protein KTT_07510 [Tengunoibacter tsumagoiensis]
MPEHVRRHISSGSPYEPILGVTRAVRVGPLVVVGGTAPIGVDGQIVGIGNAAAQAERCLEIIRNSLAELGASLDTVVRTRILLTNIEDWGPVGLIHGKFFGEVLPVTTVMQVSRFADPEWLIEIEADAYLTEEG